MLNLDQALDLQAAGILAMIDVTASSQLNTRDIRDIIAANKGSANAFGDLKLGHGEFVASGATQDEGNVIVERDLVAAGGHGDLNGSDKLELKHDTLTAGAKVAGKGKLSMARAYSDITAKGSAAVSAFAGVNLGHHGLVDGGSDIKTHALAYGRRDIPTVAAKGAIAAYASSDIDLGRHDHLKADAKADAHASAVIGRRFPEIVAAGSTHGSQSAELGLAHHDLIGASSSDSAKGTLLVSRGTPDIAITGFGSVSSANNVHLSHGIAATDASSIHGQGAIAVTRSLPLSGLDAFSDSNLNSPRQGTGSLQANSLTTAMGSFFGEDSRKRGINSAGEGTVVAGKIGQVEGSGYLAASKTGVVGESEGNLKAGPVKVAESEGGHLAAH